MPQSESVAKLTEALAKAQSEFEQISKNRVGQIGNLKFGYSTLSEVLDSVRPSLNKYAIFLSQPIITDENTGNQKVTTKVQLGDEWISTDGIPLTKGLVSSAQLGKEVTYAKRYDLISFIGVCAEDDDEDAPDLKKLNEQKQQNKPAPSKFQPSNRNSGPYKDVKDQQGFKKPEEKNLPETLEEQRKIPGSLVNIVSTRPTKEVSLEDPNDPLPAELYDEAKIDRESLPVLADDARQTAEEMEAFVPLSEKRHNEIQAYLGELVQTKVVGRRPLALWLDSRHGGKRSFDVSATVWEETIKLLEDSASSGTIKDLLKNKE